MNNEQFRRLVSTNASASQDGGTSTASKPRSLLGARPKSSNPAGTARSYGANFFKKTTGNGGANEQKKSKTNVPKGTKLAAGYIDRTQEKRHDEEEDETAQRLKALEEQMKEGEIDVATFEQMRDEITGGDVGKTHLVKGLDRKLLERIRRGENVLAEKKDGDGAEANDEELIDDDDAFNELEKHEVQAVVKKERVKQGEKGTFVPPAAGQKRSRNQILAEMKAQREAAKSAARPQLGAGFKKIRKDDGPRIEIDEKGREVLITVDEDGNVKRKIKKIKTDGRLTEKETSKPTKNKDLPLGADVVIPKYDAPPPEESDDDIFAEAGYDFNPLADLEDDGTSDVEGSASNNDNSAHNTAHPEQGKEIDKSGSEEGEASEAKISAPKPMVPEASSSKNYFNDDPSSFSVLSNIKNDFSADRLATLAKSQRAKELSEAPRKEAETEEEASRRRRREAMLASATRDRDMEDMDMGFGGSRFDDAEEMAMDDTKVKFSRWTGGGDNEDDEDGGGKGGGSKRKRGPKKKKGDKNSVTDVMGAMERQKKG